MLSFPQKKSFRLLILLALAAALVLSGLGLWVAGRGPSSQLPVLMYHHLAPTAGSNMVVTPGAFEQQMAALAQNGWHSVTTQQLIDYADKGTPLPEKAVLITFDDGYTSNLELAGSVLERYGLNAVIFVIGINAGQAVYAHSGQPLDPPRFALEEARPYLDSGVLELQSHTYDMHQLESYGFSGRDGVLPLEGESQEEYAQALAADCQKERDLFQEHLGQEITALAYPFGFHCQQAEEILTREGIRLTVTTQSGPNQIRAGDPASIRLLNRYTITDQTSQEELLGLLNWRQETFFEKVLRHLGVEL